MPQDYVEAIKWYHLAADQGETSAQCCLAGMYVRADGAVPDHGVRGDRHPDDYQPDDPLDPFPVNQ